MQCECACNSSVHGAVNFTVCRNNYRDSLKIPNVFNAAWMSNSNFKEGKRSNFHFNFQENIR